MKKYAFVVPRFGEGIMGGAETLVSCLSQKLIERGDEVEVWTTCAKDNRTWDNFFPEEETVACGVPTKRFLVDDRDLDSWIPKQIRISEGLMLTVDEQLDWMKESVNSHSLYRHIANHHSDYEALFFAPYLFGTTFWGALIAPEKSVLIPCLHDEAYAYLDIISVLFKKVKGCVFNAIPEMELAQKLYGQITGGEVGMGFEPVADIENIEPYFDLAFPYFTYVGRKETGKNAHTIIDAFVDAKERGAISEDTRLVFIGGGDMADLHRPQALERKDILDAGYVTELEKKQIIKHAHALIQPSVNESFSIVLFEAWLLGTPVVVHGYCAVTLHHVLQSKGGLYFTETREFSEVLRELAESEVLRDRLSTCGARYVQERYSWQAVLERFDSVLDTIMDTRSILSVKD